MEKDKNQVTKQKAIGPVRWDALLSRDPRKLPFEFWVAIERVEDVRCEGDHLVGRWAHPFKLYRPFSNLPCRHLIEDFLNWGDDPASIVKFTRKFGVFTPVQIGQQFRVPLSSWRELQVHFRQLFSWLVTLVSPPVQMNANLTTEIKGLLSYEEGKARLKVSTLEQFLLLPSPDLEGQLFLLLNLLQGGKQVFRLLDLGLPQGHDDIALLDTRLGGRRVGDRAAHANPSAHVVRVDFNPEPGLPVAARGLGDELWIEARALRRVGYDQRAVSHELE